MNFIWNLLIKSFEQKEEVYRKKKRKNIQCNTIIKSILALPKYAYKIAIFMKNIGLLGQFKTKKKKEKNRT